MAKKKETLLQRQRRLLREQRARRDARNKERNTKRLPSEGDSSANSRSARSQRRNTRRQTSARNQQVMSEGMRQFIKRQNARDRQTKAAQGTKSNQIRVGQAAAGKLAKTKSSSPTSQRVQRANVRVEPPKQIRGSQSRGSLPAASTTRSGNATNNRSGTRTNSNTRRTPETARSNRVTNGSRRTSTGTAPVTKNSSTTQQGPLQRAVQVSRQGTGPQAANNRNRQGNRNGRNQFRSNGRNRTLSGRTGNTGSMTGGVGSTIAGGIAAPLLNAAAQQLSDRLLKPAVYNSAAALRRALGGGNPTKDMDGKPIGPKPMPGVNAPGTTTMTGRTNFAGPGGDPSGSGSGQARRSTRSGNGLKGPDNKPFRNTSTGSSTKGSDKGSGTGRGKGNSNGSRGGSGGSGGGSSPRPVPKPKTGANDPRNAAYIAARSKLNANSTKAERDKVRDMGMAIHNKAFNKKSTPKSNQPANAGAGNGAPRPTNKDKKKKKKSRANAAGWQGNQNY